MNIDNAAFRIINIPIDFEKQGNISFYTLLGNSGYFAMPDSVTEDVIKTKLDKYPDTIDAWMQYSEDKRSDEGWYLMSRGTEYEVGLLKLKQHVRGSKTYSNRAEACAVFIKREIEVIRSRRSQDADC